ncbi:MAG: DUF4923 family protein [Bacteroidaceae bacterium]|nr:DUF4923 family protein [Bacteroidaceae bacterium]
MKRLFLMFAVCAMAVTASAQLGNALGGLLQKVATSATGSSNTTTDGVKSTAVGALQNVLGNIVGNSMPVSEATLNGTWNYNGISCVLESENALSNIGGSAVAGSIENKLDGYLAKVGVKPGACTFTFKEEGACAFTVAGRTINGTYTLDKENKTVALNFHTYVSMTAHVSYNLSNLELVFEADKLLTLIKKAASVVSSNSGSTSSDASNLGYLQTVTSFLGKYDGMMLGMKLNK